MELDTPLMENFIKNFHFVFWMSPLIYIYGMLCDFMQKNC